MPDSFFILSKENLDLARDEVVAIARSYDRFTKVQTFSNVVRFVKGVFLIHHIEGVILKRHIMHITDFY